MTMTLLTLRGLKCHDNGIANTMLALENSACEGNSFCTCYSSSSPLAALRQHFSSAKAAFRQESYQYCYNHKQKQLSEKIPPAN